MNYSHDDAAIDRTIEVIEDALEIYARALNDGVEAYLTGRSVRPVFRRLAGKGKRCKKRF